MSQVVEGVGVHSSIGSTSDCRSRGHKFESAWPHKFHRVDHEIISTVILPILLIEEGQLLAKVCVPDYWLTT